MEFFNQAIDILKILVMALGAGLAVWGVINLLEGYGSDNPAAKSQGIKQLMAMLTSRTRLCSRASYGTSTALTRKAYSSVKYLQRKYSPMIQTVL